MSNRIFTLIASMLAAGMLYVPAAFADDSVPTPEDTPIATIPEQYTSPTVHVTAGRVQQELLEVPMSVSIITEEEIRKSTATTVGELLRDVPGVQLINSGGGGFNRIKIRGEDANRVLILIDGQKIAENKSMDGPPILITATAIERIEVIRGPASVLYGSEAIGGVVNIITKQGGPKPIQGEVTAIFNGASEGFQEGIALWGSSMGWNYRVSGSYNDQGDRHGTRDVMKNTSYRQKEGSAFLSYDFAKLTLGGGVDLFDSSLHSGSIAEGYENFAVDLPTWKREKFRLFWEGKEWASWLPRVRFDTFYQTNEKHMYNNVDVVGMPLIVQNEADNRNKQFGLSLQTDFQLGDYNYLIAGYEYNRDMLKATTTTDASTTDERVRPLATEVVNGMGLPPMMIPGMINTLTTSMVNGMTYQSVGIHKGHMDTHAAFAQMETQLPWNFTANYGMRYTWTDSTMKRADGSTYDYQGIRDDLDVGNTGSFSKSRAVFNAGLLWTGIDHMSLRATFGQGFRVPSLQERFLQSSMGGGTVLPNPGLKPETSDNYEIGARYARDGLVLDAAVFYSDADNYIASRTIDSNSNTSTYVNVGSARTHGVELFASYDLPYGFTPYVSGTWIKRKYNYEDWSTWKSGTPELVGRAGLRFTRDMTEDATFWADTYMRFSSPVDDESGTDDDRTLIHYNHWETLNFATGVDFGEERQYSLSAEVLNITNKKYYVSSTAIEESGIHANIKFSFRF